ncbi:thioredoxin family protein [uncultured Dokdonia sp.]|uniref:protein-disulfide reductase DsbD family protein n=1 Tax=uncultured Dokdonia sp. TaxID=575653 RepID=UPI002603525E|nr:thioredoxin family protein [uncultured Dokdonia sp.]
MRKTLTLLAIFMLTTTLAFAQVFGGEQGFGSGGPKFDPVKWSGEVEKISDTEYILHYDVVIEKDWHVYSQFTPANGPNPLRFEFLPENDATYTLDGKAIESPTHREYSDIFEVDEVFWKDTGRISQKVILKDPNTPFIKSIVKHQTCKEVCINQEFNIVHDLVNTKVLVFDNYTDFENYGIDTNNAKKEKKLDQNLQHQEKDEGLWLLFFLSFLGGLAALLTPCVFPMIPMTVSFFTKQSKSRAQGIKNAIIYGLCIILIYVVLGLAVTAIFGETAIVEVSTSVPFNIAFFVLLVVFAISFLGAFEIMLPQSWANKVDSQADRGGLVGIFFMALALAIVSFSCTGPIVGTALVESATKGGIAPIISMLGFSSAIALPFALFALFPGWLNSLPKSGGWLNTVKVVLGFLELGLAFKFLSNADLVAQTNILEREIFLAIIIAILVGLTIYLFGKLKLPHDSDLNHISVGRLLLGLTTLSLVIYMIPGLWGAPLKLISGFPPPMKNSESPYGVGGKSAIVSSDKEIPDHAELGPHDLLSFTDYDAGVAYAKKENKAILLDFTGYACINCRRMEERVWSDPKVLNILRNDVVLISLYGDSREELPESEQGVSASGRRIKTVGNKWNNFQIERYGILAAPYYVLLDHDEKELNTPVSYTPDINEYLAWLKEGITRFNNN